MTSPYPLQYLLGRPGASVITGTGNWCAVALGPTMLTITTTGLGTISAGTLLIEETDDPNDGSGAAASQVSTLDCTTITAGKKNCAHIGPSAYLFVRARLSVNVAGGGSVFVSIAGS